MCGVSNAFGKNLSSRLSIQRDPKFTDIVRSYFDKDDLTQAGAGQAAKSTNIGGVIGSRIGGHIDNIVKPISKGKHASKIIFLAADAFGILPAVSKLSYEQAEYHFLSGFTAKLAGTERGVTKPEPAFSACYGAAFLMLHPTEYSNVLSQRMKSVKSDVFLVNTGWNGEGKRISLKNTRLIIDAILNNELDDVLTQNIPIFNLAVPLKVNNVPSNLLDPRSTWSSNEDWSKKAKELAQLFINNFQKF